MGMWTESDKPVWLPITCVLDDNVPEIIKTELKSMEGFDGCSCQALEWGLHVVTGKWYSRKYGCGNGLVWLDRMIDDEGLHDIKIDEGTDEYQSIVSICIWELELHAE